jgi:ATP-dependent Clp protease adaptor protein ClpS
MVLEARMSRQTMLGMSDPADTPQVTVKSDHDLQKPDMYRVVLHNDDYTTMEFVVEVLVVVFQKSVAEAARIMLNVHRRGIGIAGIYTLDIANTKTKRVREMARAREYPLRCSVEPA